MASKPYLSVIIPAHNEAKRLPLTLIDIDRHLARAAFLYEIIVVDNASNDATKEIAHRFASIIKNLRVIECPTKGKGIAVQKGMLEARGEIRLFADADNSTSIDQFFKMEHYFKEGYDVVIASRYIPGARMEPSQAWYRKFMRGNFFIQWVILKGIADTQCGFKAFSERAATTIFPLADIVGFAFDIEVLALARHFGFRIAQMPVVWVNDFASTVKASSYIRVFIDVVRIRSRFVRGYYGER
ncbi:MAG: dolichyl-phosphate beta-glucosyltransferase [Candidatus Paceibacterota bacterium]|jgi:dolichyl-phosphate beta-glucosyltransferase